MRLFKGLMGVVLGIFAGVALAGCTLNSVLPNITNPINQSEVYVALNGYGVLQTAAVAYTKLGRCPAGVHTDFTHYCREAGVVAKLAKADATVEAARGPLEAFVRNPANYPSLNYGALLAAFRSAVANLKAVEASNGVH